MAVEYLRSAIDFGQPRELTEEQLASLLLVESDFDAGWQEFSVDRAEFVEFYEDRRDFVDESFEGYFCQGDFLAGGAFANRSGDLFMASSAEEVCADTEDVIAAERDLEEATAELFEHQAELLGEALGMHLADFDVRPLRTEHGDDAFVHEVTAVFEGPYWEETLHQVNVVVVSDHGVVAAEIEGWNRRVPREQEEWAVEILRGKLERLALDLG